MLKPNDLVIKNVDVPPFPGYYTIFRVLEFRKGDMSPIIHVWPHEGLDVVIEIATLLAKQSTVDVYMDKELIYGSSSDSTERKD